MLIGTYVLSAGYYDAYYVRAQKVRTLIKRDFDEAWNKVDVVLTPATPSAAFAPGEITDPVQMYLNDVFTVTVNMAGLPGISVPGGLNEDGLPLALQLIGKPFDEETLFQRRQGDREGGRAVRGAAMVVVKARKQRFPAFKLFAQRETQPAGPIAQTDNVPVR